MTAPLTPDEEREAREHWKGEGHARLFATLDAERVRITELERERDEAKRDLAARDAGDEAVAQDLGGSTLVGVAYVLKDKLAAATKRAEEREAEIAKLMGSPDYESACDMGKLLDNERERSAVMAKRAEYAEAEQDRQAAFAAESHRRAKLRLESLRAARRESAQLREALRAVEWAERDNDGTCGPCAGGEFCPECGGSRQTCGNSRCRSSRKSGHAPDCIVGRALSVAGGASGGSEMTPPLPDRAAILADMSKAFGAQVDENTAINGLTAGRIAEMIAMAIALDRARFAAPDAIRSARIEGAEACIAIRDEASGSDLDRAQVLCDEIGLSSDTLNRIATALAAARREERERCAKVGDVNAGMLRTLAADKERHGRDDGTDRLAADCWAEYARALRSLGEEGA